MKNTNTNQPLNPEMPQNIEAEISVIGELINNPEKMDEVIETLKPDDFYRNDHQIIYAAMMEYYHEEGEGPDYITLCDLLGQKGQLEEVGGASELTKYIWRVNSYDYKAVSLQASAKLVTGASVQRQNIQTGHKVAMIGYHEADPEKGRNAVESLLYKLTMSHAPQSDFESLEDILGAYMTDVERFCKNRGTIQGVPSGFTDLDRMTEGFQKADLILLAGRPSMGKTALGMGMGYNAARQGKVVAVFSLEMGKKQLGARLLSLRSGIASNLIRGGWLNEKDFEKLIEANDHLGALPIYIDDTSGSPVSSMRSKLRRLKAKLKRPIDLVIVDYLGLMEPEDGENRNQEISGISRGLKGIGREFDVPVLALAQLSRAVEGRQSKVPQLSDLRDSGSLEQDADVVMFVYRDDYYAGFNPDGTSKSLRPKTADILVAKHRNGPVGEITLSFNGALTRFDNLDATAGED